MDKNDMKRFLSAIDALAELFDKELSDTTKEIYFNALKQFEINQVRIGISECASKCRYFPKPVEIIEAITGPEKQNLEDHAERQATVVLDAISSCGSYQTPIFDDPVTALIVSKRFGWGHICVSVHNSNRQFFIRDFKDAYLSHGRNDQPLIEATPQVKEIAANVCRELPAPERPKIVQMRQWQQRQVMLAGRGPEHVARLMEQRKAILGEN